MTRGGGKTARLAKIFEDFRTKSEALDPCPKCRLGRLRTTFSVDGAPAIQIQREEMMCQCPSDHTVEEEG